MSSFMMHLPLDGPLDMGTSTFKWTSAPSMTALGQQHQQQHQSEIKSDGTFPVKLHNMLQKVQGTRYQELINWDPDGKSFVIYKPKEFADQLMGMYFKQTKYKSFQRQLNFYGFVRSRRGIIRGVYTHPLFQRDKPDLCQTMRRMDANNTNNNDSTFEASSTIRQQQQQLQSHIPLPLPNSVNHTQQPFGLDRSQQQQQQQLLIDIPNSLLSERRRPQNRDDDSIETIDGLPLLGYTPCNMTEDDTFWH